MTYIIRDHNREIFEARKAKIKEIQQTLNAPFDEERIKVDLFDQYYNMREVIEKICPLSKLLNKQWKNCQFNQLLNLFAVERMAQKFYLGIPTPNIFAGGENMHGRFEFVSLQAMEKATNVIIKIAELNAK